MWRLLQLTFRHWVFLTAPFEIKRVAGDSWRSRTVLAPPRSTDQSSFVKNTNNVIGVKWSYNFPTFMTSFCWYFSGRALPCRVLPHFHFLSYLGRRTMFGNLTFFFDLTFCAKTYILSIKSYFEANKKWILAPKWIDKFWREDSNFSRSKLNLSAKIVGFCAKIEIGEKMRIFEQWATTQLNTTIFYANCVLSFALQSVIFNANSRWCFVCKYATKICYRIRRILCGLYSNNFAFEKWVSNTTTKNFMTEILCGFLKYNLRRLKQSV